ncbi:MAG: response regulator [Dehalococcoides mccartyi]|uniref:response regulator n=1 Tax=Dehalococcoides mccartyi TaxID=61435 RepID=UPI0030F6C388
MKFSLEKLKRMLIVDDTEAIRHILQNMFRIEAGFAVGTAASGAIALDMLSKNKYDILLIDLDMPIMSGIELYQRIKDKYPDIVERVIFMSAGNPNASTRHFLVKTRQPFLLKPFTVAELLKCI